MSIDPAKVTRAIALIKKGPANSDYFFEQLKSAAWIEPLAREKLFQPYSAVRKGDTLSFPIWVPGQYLARMASIEDAQVRVADILTKLPNSDNPRVYEVVADAALAMAPEVAVRLVPQLIRGLELPYQLLLPEKAVKLAALLCGAGKPNEAMRLSRAILTILPSHKTAGAEIDRAQWGWREVKGRVDDWEYGQLLEQIRPSLVHVAGVRALALLVDLLESAVAASRDDEVKEPDDYSYIWRPTIANDSYRENVRDHLVTAVRDAANQLVTTSPAMLREVTALLRSRTTHVFQRIVLFLLGLHGPHDPALLSELFSDPNDWDEVGLQPEYEMALGTLFGQLPSETRLRFVEWIQRGPEIESYISFRRQMDGKEPSEADVERHRGTWIRDHLSVIAGDLPNDAKRKLEQLIERFGAPREPGPLYRVTAGFRGEASPLTEEETLNLGWPDLVKKLRDWTPPSSDFDGPSKEGLAGSVRQRVAAYPVEAIAQLELVTGLDPVYISSILEALREVVRRKESIDWQPVLVFLHRVLKDDEVAQEQTNSWRWVAVCAASLLEDGFDAGAASIEIALRGQVWPVLALLCEDSDPTPEHEARYGGTNMDPTTLSLNTVRGKAFHALVRYALWWRRHVETTASGDRLSSGFTELPEVKSLLEAHLDPQLEPSLAVRAVYGQWFPWIVLLDREWSEQNVERIFPTERDSSSFFGAAWGAYVVYSRPYTGVLPVIRSAYVHAIDLLSAGDQPEIGLGERPSDHLAQHLAAYYWRGEVTLAEGDLIAEFFRQADGKLRARLVESLGRGLRQLEGPAPDPVATRLTALWDWRSKSVLDPAEAESFGWWIGSGKLDPKWTLGLLQALLSAGVKPEPDHLAVQQLASLSLAFPTAALRCLDQIIDLSANDWSIHGWLDELRTILVSGLNSGSVEAIELAKRIINKLGAMRLRDFRELLKTIPATS